MEAVVHPFNFTYKVCCWVSQVHSFFFFWLPWSFVQHFGFLQFCSHSCNSQNIPGTFETQKTETSSYTFLGSLIFFSLFMLKLPHSSSVTIIQSFYLPHARIPSLLLVPAGFFWECSDLLLLNKWTCVIHRLSKLNKKTETSPQSLVAQVLEPKKNLMEEERLQKAAFGKLSIKDSTACYCQNLQKLTTTHSFVCFKLRLRKRTQHQRLLTTMPLAHWVFSTFKMNKSLGFHANMLPRDAQDAPSIMQVQL